MSEHVEVSKSSYYAVFAALIFFTITTWWTAQLDLGQFNTLVALTIAVIKALLVILYFMHVRYSSKLIWVVVVGSLFWLGLMIVLTMTDFLGRTWGTYPIRSQF